jgi:Mg-chelatase subunit ChlD
MMQNDSALSRSLSYLLRGLSGSDAAVQFMPDAENGHPAPGLRPIIQPQHVWLPSPLMPGVHEDCTALERASIAHAAAHLLYSAPAREVTRLKPMGIAVVSAIEDARVEYLLMQRLPGVRRWFSQAMQQEVDTQDDFASMIASLSFGLLHAQAPMNDYWVNKARNLFFSVMNQGGLDDYDGYRAIASILANDLGQMRVQFNAQAYINPVKYRDDNSYLWNFSSQQSEPELSIESSGGQSASATLNETLDPAQQTIRFAMQTFLYPELDYRLGIERKDWCTVLEYRSASSAVLNRAKLSPHARRTKLRVYENNASALSREKLFRQQQGDLLDMNAVVDSVALARQGVMGDGDHYIRHGFRKKNISFLLILDLSASVGSVVNGHSQSILDLEKAAAMMLAQCAHEQGDRIAVHGFCSDQRKGIHYYRYLDFDQSFSSSGLQALEHAEPQYSTRMGAALRHGASFFSTGVTDAQVIIMMTDGVPSDIDVFDPEYLVEDARTVVHQSKKSGIDIYGLVMDSTAEEQTKKIFGSSHSRIVSNTQSLTMHLESLYRQIKA